MPYAQGRTFYDADSHLMELSEWLPKYADPGIRERIRPLYLGGAGAKAAELIAQAKARAADPGRDDQTRRECDDGQGMARAGRV